MGYPILNDNEEQTEFEARASPFFSNKYVSVPANGTNNTVPCKKKILFVYLDIYMHYIDIHV